MEVDELLKKHRGEILELAHHHGAYSVRVFGSAARGEAGPGSDIDFLVEMEAGRSLFGLGGLLMDLQELLGRRVDVVVPDGLHRMIRNRVLAEAVPL